MLVGVVVAALVWVGAVPGLSDWVWRVDEKMRDQLSLILPPTKEREDLLFVGVEDTWRENGSVTKEEIAKSRALTLMDHEKGNVQLDRRVCAELIEKLVAAGVRVIIFDILFIGSSGNAEVDREFAEALNRHHEKVVLSKMFRPLGDGNYQYLSSVEQLPLLDAEKKPHEGYVNLWPDGADEVVRRMYYTTSYGELLGREREEGEQVYESLSALTGRLMGVELPEERNPRIRYAVSAGEEGSFAKAYAPHSLHGVFVDEVWEKEYGGGEYFRDKVVLVSTSQAEDGDRHPIPGTVIYGGQFHLHALGALLEDSYWGRAPQWVDLLSLLVMAGLAVMIGIAVRHPLAILGVAIALGGGFVMLCAAISGMTGVLFAGTPGLVGLVTVVICAEVGYLVSRGDQKSEVRSQ